ncbi:hypothetical protein BDW62DRAFT_209622 [Aspergillus aurantiobrunneus]
MCLYLPTALLLSALSVAPALAGQQVLVIWSGLTFSITGLSGKNVFVAGSSLVGENSERIYNKGYLDGYNLYIFTDHEFQLEGGCLGGEWYLFRYQANQIGVPQQCKVIRPDRNSVGTRDASKNTDFFGLGILITGVCKVQCELVDRIKSAVIYID